MSYGQKMGSLKALKQSMAKGGSGGAWIKYIPKNGSMNVRFIQEPEEWVNYYEHYDTVARKSFPCNGETNCPGCNSDARKTARYLANAVDVDSDRVIPLQMPKDLANRLVVRYEKYGTLTDRDYELSRAGEGLDTVYDMDASPKDNKKITKYAPLDLMKALDDAFTSVFGGDGDDDDAPATKAAKSAVKSKKPSAAAQIAHGDVDAEDVDDDDEDDDLPDALKKDALKDPKFTPEVDEDDEDDTEDVDAPDVDADGDPIEDDEDDDEVEYTEADLKALPLGALRAVARDFSVSTKGKKADAIIAEIMAGGSE